MENDSSHLSKAVKTRLPPEVFTNIHDELLRAANRSPVGRNSGL